MGPIRTISPAPIPQGFEPCSSRRSPCSSSLSIASPDEAAHIDLAPADFVDPDLGALFEHLASGEHSASDLPAHLAAITAALGALAPEPPDEVDAAQAIEIAALKLRERNLRHRLDDTRAQLARAGEADMGMHGEIAGLAAELAEVMRRQERQTVLHTADVEQRDQ